MRDRAVIPAALLVVTPLLAGCAGDDDGGDWTATDTTTTTVLPASTTTVTRAPPIVAVFGDSLAFQAWSEIETATARAGYDLAGVAVPGDALCDAPDQIAALMSQRPAFVVLAYIGNNNTPCTARATGEALADIYEDAAERVAQIAMGSDVVLVGPPDMTGEHFAETAPLVRERYERVAARHDHVAFVDGREFLSPGGYTERLPCLPSEGPEVGCEDGTIIVRFFDGVHLDWPDGYSAGGRRWAEAIVSALPQG